MNQLDLQIPHVLSFNNFAGNWALKVLSIFLYTTNNVLELELYWQSVYGTLKYWIFFDHPYLLASTFWYMLTYCCLMKMFWQRKGCFADNQSLFAVYGITKLH